MGGGGEGEGVQRTREGEGEGEGESERVWEVERGRSSDEARRHPLRRR